MKLPWPPHQSCAGVTFSTDPKNLANLHSLKHSGLTQAKAIGVISVTQNTKRRKGKAGTAVTKIALLSSTKSANKPKKATQKDILSANPARAEKSIRSLVDGVAKKGGYYRPDLRSLALQRYTALAKANAAPKPDTIKAGRSSAATVAKK